MSDTFTTAFKERHRYDLAAALAGLSARHRDVVLLVAWADLGGTRP